MDLEQHFLLIARYRSSFPIPSVHDAQRYFLAAAKTLCLKTGLPSVISTPWNGFMIAFTQTSKISVKNSLTASSVCGLVGLFAMSVLALLEADVGGVEV